MSFWSKRTVGEVDALHPFTGKRIKVDYQRDVRISADVDKELRRLPGLVAWYGQLFATAETAFKEAKHVEHNVEEDLYAELREAPTPKGQKRPNETEIKMAVKRDSRMRTAFRARMDAEKMTRNLRVAVAAVEAKRWMIMSIVKRQLREMDVQDSE